MKRRLVSSAEAVQAKSQHKKPCSDCPWARTAINGWLGSNSAEEWVGFAHGESQVECHALTGVQCAGIAIYRANVCKTPRDPSQLRLPADRKLVFANRDEFLTHHQKVPTMPRCNPTESEFERIRDILDGVESDTKSVTRKQYREFLEEVRGEIEMRLEVIDADDAADATRRR